MSDPLGRHYCPYGDIEDELSHATKCEVSGKIQSCAGLSEYCEMEEQDIIQFEIDQGERNERNRDRSSRKE